MTTPKLITLEAWVERTYGDSLTIHTARRWCRESRIHPAPKKHGREYYLPPEASYVSRDGNTLLERMLHGGSTS